MEEIVLNVNSRNYTILSEKNWTLLYVLREILGLTGTKCGCGTNDCGACRVIIDGEAVNSCARLAWKLEGKSVITIEGLGNRQKLHPIQQAFIDAGAVQCGFCTPGFIMSAVEILESGKEYTRDELRKLMSGHLCWCTGYENILNAVEKTMLRRLGKLPA